jgi:PAS domain S-box-containing protein
MKKTCRARIYVTMMTAGGEMSSTMDLSIAREPSRSTPDLDQEEIRRCSSDPEQVQLYRELLKNVKDVLWITTRDRVLYVNPAYENIWGASRERLYRHRESFLLVVHPDDQDRVRDAFEKELQEGTFDEEYRIIRPDGNVRWIHACSFPVFEGDSLVRIVGIARDVTAQKSLEQKLDYENNFFRSIIENAADGICVCHKSKDYPFLHFTVWNRRMLEITGYDISEINRLGWHQSLYPDPEIQALARRHMDDMFSGKDLVEEEWSVTRSDGTERKLLTSTSVFCVEDGVAQVLLVIRDVTRQKRAEEELRRTSSSLEEKHREVTEINMALRVLLKKRDEDREELRHSILSNLRHMVLPYLQKLKDGQASREANRLYCEIIERNLSEMASSYIWELSNRYLNLTPSEIRTAELLKKGKSTKEIAQELGVAPSTINTHREGLRRKLGITGKKTNLTTFLRTLK